MIFEFEQLLGAHFQRPNGKNVILLQGELGAGKTHLVKKIAESWGAKNISSPSFSICQIYQNQLGQDVLVHVDLYRINEDDESELEGTGFWDIFSRQDIPIFIEWPERFNWKLLPENWDRLLVKIQVDAQGKRVYEAALL